MCLFDARLDGLKPRWPRNSPRGWWATSAPKGTGATKATGAALYADPDLQTTLSDNRLNMIKLNYTFAEKELLKKQANRLIDKNLKNKSNADTELQQAFVSILFQYACENIYNNTPALKAFAIANEEYLGER